MLTQTHKKTAHAPDPEWMEFTASFLPGAQNYFITDLDSIIRDRKGNFMLIELKYNGRDISTHQRSTLIIIDRLIRAGMKCTGGKVAIPGLGYDTLVKYHGLHLLQLSGTSFKNSKIYWDRKRISQKELIGKLSFKKTGIR